MISGIFPNIFQKMIILLTKTLGQKLVILMQFKEEFVVKEKTFNRKEKNNV